MASGARPKGLALVAGLSLLQAILRVEFAYIGTTEMINECLTTPVSSATQQVINVVFLLLGLGGFLSAYGLWSMRGWGLMASALVCLATLAFDVWGMTIQSSAAIGFILTALILVLLYRGRYRFTGNIVF
jgi:hypothetical protein